MLPFRSMIDDKDAEFRTRLNWLRSWCFDNSYRSGGGCKVVDLHKLLAQIEKVREGQPMRRKTKGT
jgi:hypothetical protein